MKRKNLGIEVHDIDLPDLRIDLPDLRIDLPDWQIQELDLPELEPIMDYSLQIGEIVKASLLDEMTE